MNTAPSSLVPFPHLPVTNTVISSAEPDQIIAASLLGQTPPPPPPTSPTMGSTQKESLPPTEPLQPTETTPLVEVQETEKIPEEVEGWLQKLNQAGDIKLQNPVTHDGDILLADTEAQVVKEKLVLPLSQSDVQLGLTAKVNDSARWLAEWCVRLVKMIKDGVKYAPEPINQSNQHHP